MQRKTNNCEVAFAEHIHTVVCDDGCLLRYRVWSATEHSVASVILLSGMMSHSAWFRQPSELMSRVGLKVVGADRRGSGLNEKGRGDAPSRSALVSDLHRIIERERGTRPVYVAGWCWGALIAMCACLDSKASLNGLILLAPGIFPSQQIKSFAQREVRAYPDADPHVPCLHSPISSEMFSDRPQVRRFIECDPLAQRLFTSNFFSISSEMSRIAAIRMNQLNLPVLLLLASNDKTIDRDQTLKALQRLRSPVAVSTIDCNHGMQFEAPMLVSAQISHWLMKQGILLDISMECIHL
jgi:alpha-beta hydrolase superfamily lysophospholipase